MNAAGTVGSVAAAVAATLWVGRKLTSRLLLSRAKHRSLAGHAPWSRALARLLAGLSYDEARFFAADGAPDEVIASRREALDALRRIYLERYPRTAAATRSLAQHVPDVEFTSRYRVPWQFSAWLRAQLPTGSMLQAS